MEFVLFEGVVVSLELLLFILEFVILIAILFHMREIRQHDKLMTSEMKDLKTLHRELHETLKLLKEDILELNKNQAEMHDAIKLLGRK
ncbi:MAG: hypothetical protein NTU61_04645 [Candidatus Altiarchaeota archaeon]|nr:hypothetical protein [Candidatus Altiarchaeota archaeon]